MKKSTTCSECGQAVTEDPKFNFRCDSFHAVLDIDDADIVDIYACDGDQHTTRYPPALVKSEVIAFAKWLNRVSKVMSEEEA